MANLHCTTTSTPVEVTDEEEVEELLDEYLGIPEKTYVQNGELHIIGHQSFHPRKEGQPDCTEEFLDRISQYLEGELVIQTVGNEKCRFPVVACQFRVTDDGVFYTDLEIDEKRMEMIGR